MTNICLFGGSGYIGANFFEKVSSDKSISLKIADRSLCPNPNKALLDNQWIKKMIFGSEIVVYSVFDHQYRVNLNGLLNLLKICEEMEIKKFVYLSSISIYDCQSLAKNISAPQKSKLLDPYTRVKLQEHEAIVSKLVFTGQISILVPGVVISPNKGKGSWDNYFIRASKYKHVELPFDGYCPVTYLDDLSENIIKECKKEGSEGDDLRIVISLWEKWSSLYKAYGSDLVCFKKSFQYSSNFLLNFLIFLSVRTIFSYIANPFFIFLKRKRKSKRIKNEFNDKVFRPVAMSRKLHFVHSDFDK